jgi:hypothetical protein
LQKLALDLPPNRHRRSPLSQFSATAL